MIQNTEEYRGVIQTSNKNIGKIEVSESELSNMTRKVSYEEYEVSEALEEDEGNGLTPSYMHEHNKKRCLPAQQQTYGGGFRRLFEALQYGKQQYESDESSDQTFLELLLDLEEANAEPCSWRPKQPYILPSLQ